MTILLLGPMIDRILVVCQSKPESLKWVEILQAAIKQSRQQQHHQHSNSSSSNIAQQQQQQNSNANHVSSRAAQPPYRELTRWQRDKILSGRMSLSSLRALAALKHRKRDPDSPSVVVMRPKKSCVNRAERILFPSAKKAENGFKRDSDQFVVLVDAARKSGGSGVGVPTPSTVSTSYHSALSTVPPPANSEADDIDDTTADSISRTEVVLSVESPTDTVAFSSPSPSSENDNPCPDWNRLGGGVASLERMGSVTRSLSTRPAAAVAQKVVSRTNSAPYGLNGLPSVDKKSEFPGQDSQDDTDGGSTSEIARVVEAIEGIARRCHRCGKDYSSEGGGISGKEGKGKDTYMDRKVQAAIMWTQPPKFSFSSETAAASKEGEDRFSSSARSSSVASTIRFIDSGSLSSLVAPFCPPQQLDYEEIKRHRDEFLKQSRRLEKQRSKEKQEEKKGEGDFDLAVVPVEGELRVASILPEIEEEEEDDDGRETRSSCVPVTLSSPSPVPSSLTGGTASSTSTGAPTVVSSFSTYVGSPIFGSTPVSSFDEGEAAGSSQVVSLCWSPGSRQNKMKKRSKSKKTLALRPSGPMYKSTLYAHWSMKAVLAVDLMDCVGPGGKEVVI